MAYLVYQGNTEFVPLILIIIMDWLLFASFFAAYTSSNLVNKKMRKGEKQIDDDVDDMCEKAARLRYKKRQFCNNVDFY